MDEFSGKTFPKLNREISSGVIFLIFISPSIFFYLFKQNNSFIRLYLKIKLGKEKTTNIKKKNSTNPLTNKPDRYIHASFEFFFRKIHKPFFLVSKTLAKFTFQKKIWIKLVEKLHIHINMGMINQNEMKKNLE